MKLNLFLKKTLIFGLLAFFFSLLLSFFVGEFIVKHLFPQDTYKMTRLVGLHFFEESPTIPFTLKKNVKDFHHIGYTHEFDHFVSTNSLGTRGKEFKKEKEADSYRILCLGDSMTFGWGVQDDENYPFLLEEYLNEYARKEKIDKKFEVINAGFTDGITLDSFYVYLSKIGNGFEPDLIILDLFPYNDLSDLLEMSWEKTDENGYPTKIVSLKQKVKDGYLVKRQKTNWKYEIPFLRNSHLAMLLFNALEKGSPKTVEKIKNLLGVVEEKEEFSLDERLKCIYSLQADKCHASLLKSLEKTKFLLAGFKEFAHKQNKDLLVTIMVSPDQAVSLSQKEEREELLSQVQPQKYFRDFLSEEKIVFFDLLPTLSQGKAQEFFYVRDGHLTAKGHEQAARAILGVLEQNYLEGEFTDNL